MKIVHENNLNRFAAIDGDNVAGFITYSPAGENRLILDHTEVDSAYGGQGVGKKILMDIIDYARNNQIKIIPLCPFTKSVFDKNEDFRDVL